MAISLVHYLLDTVTRSQEREAVVFKGRRVIYAELWAQVGAVAAFLKEKGLKKGDRVGILMENSPEYIAVYYGILASGGVAIGLNTATKSRDLFSWLKHSQATWLFADARHRELPAVSEKLSESLEIITVGKLPKPLPGAKASWSDVLKHVNPQIDLSGINNTGDLASIIYTSGTTGKPKGVMLSHGNLAANTRSILEYLELKETDIIVNVLPFYYSYGNSVLHTHMAAGGCLVLENSMVYPHKILERMVEEHATGFSGVPATFALLLSRTTLSDFDLSSVRYMTQAGGPMPPANQLRLTAELPHIKFFVMYGQTEASARLSYLPPNKFAEKTGSVGIPIPGVEIDIRDKEGNKVTKNRTGEIWARGDNIMMGYWKNPEKTREVLQNGWLKTGDMAHFDEDHYIYIDGRNSEMIKVGANRISPNEIEEVISELEGIEEVAAVGVDDEMLGQVVKVVIVCRPGVKLEQKEIQRFCRKNLAQYKIPKYVEFASSLPKTSSGKIKRHLL